MKDKENETYLGDVITNNVAEKQTFETALIGIEKLGEKWLNKYIGMYRRKIVANTLLRAKIIHRASVNGISRDMKAKIRKDKYSTINVVQIIYQYV